MMSRSRKEPKGKKAEAKRPQKIRSVATVTAVTATDRDATDAPATTDDIKRIANMAAIRHARAASRPN
jgi:hypothetical protein